uniref:Peptidase S1 domain-containing protein n=1 Tax=Magallana gigas TaxID=29159 RepID=A0A8W8IFA0_MAGGI
MIGFDRNFDPLHPSIALKRKHPEYSTNHGLPHDIAVVQLSRTVKVTGHYVRTACIACMPHDDDMFDDADYCYISGWGYTQGTPVSYDEV